MSGWGEEKEWLQGWSSVLEGGARRASHLTDLRLAAASGGHPHAMLLPLPFFPSALPRPRRRTTKGVVGGQSEGSWGGIGGQSAGSRRGQEETERVRRRGAFASGSLHSAGSPERRRQAKASIPFFFFCLRGRSCEVAGRMGRAGGERATGSVFGYMTGKKDMGMSSP